MESSRRLAPEHPFPTGVNDSWDALQWAAANATSLSANPALGFIVGGGSAGGNIAAVLTHLARDENLHPPLTGQYLCVPALLPSEVVPEQYKHEYQSATTNVKDPVLGKLNTGRVLGSFGPPALPYSGKVSIRAFAIISDQPIIMQPYINLT